MKIISTNVYIGPNIYALFPVIRHVIDLGVLEQWPTAKIGQQYVDALIEALPGLGEHGCSYRTEGGFVRRLREDEGTWLGHVLEHLALELQNLAGSEVTFGKTRSLDNAKGHYNMVFEYQQRDVGLQACQLGIDLLLHLLPDEIKQQLDKSIEIPPEFDFATERDEFIRFAQRNELGPSTKSLAKAAEERDIPYIRLNKYSLVQFGHGKYQKRIQATITSETRHIAVEISCDKEETHNLLNDLGLPVPKQRLVYSVREAKKVAKYLGFPVVIKPLNANHGRGVTINIQSDDEVDAAFEHAKKQSKSRGILVETYIQGIDHRLLVVNNQLIAVAKRMPGHVVGDGVNTIAQLVDIVNSDPRRGIGHEKVLTQLEFDDQAKRLMAEKGLDQETVLAKGEELFLRATANLSTGGTAEDVTDIVHPDNRDMAIRAAQAVGLDVAGIDFLTQDISQSYKEMGGAIVEVNAAPGFRMHVSPSSGQPRDVAGPVMDMLFPPDTPSRIPIAAVTGTNGKTTTCRMLAHIMKSDGHCVGLTSTDGVYIDGQLTVKGDMTGPVSAQMVLRDPSVDMAVLETARGGLLRAGMGYSWTNVSACLNVTADHLGLKGIDTIEQLAQVKRIVVEVAKDAVVLNADDVLCLKMADYTQADYLCYVTMNPGHALVKEHIRAGGRAVVLEKGINGDMITLYDKEAHIPLLWSHLIPATQEGKALHNVQNAMFAAALAYNLGKSLEAIRHGLRTFNTTFFQAPGRMNIFDEHPFKVILDYGHNPAAMLAMTQFVNNLDCKGRRVCVLGVAGDRRDEDIREVAKAVAKTFDYYICKEDDHKRGREPGAVAALLKAGLQAEGVDGDLISVIADESKALEFALNQASTNDLLLVFGDNLTRCWKQITKFTTSEGDAGNSANEASLGSRTLPTVDAFVLEEGQTLLRDQRGVRLARTEDSD